MAHFGESAPLPDANNKVRCTCHRFCKGGKDVSLSTWYAHAAPSRLATAFSLIRTTTVSPTPPLPLPAASSVPTCGAKSTALADESEEELEERPQIPPYEEEDPQPEAPGTSASRIEDIQLSLDYIKCIQEATFENGGLEIDCVERLRDPIQEPIDISDPDLCLSLDLFMETSNSLEKTYDGVRSSVCRRHPEDDILTHHLVKKKVVEMTGVVPLLHDMCQNSCMAYTGPLADLELCRVCKAPRFDETGSSRKFSTMPLGPQLQALFRSPAGAESMKYRVQKTEEIKMCLEVYEGEYEDVFHGQDYLDAVERGDIGNNDIVLIGSIDGAQLYRNKASDCWIGIWIIADMHPQLRYNKKAVLVAFVIGGPNKPKIMDSFLFPGLHHLSALQKVETADGPGMTYLNGLVGHHGAYGCRLYCSLQGRRKDGASTYYPMMSKPDNYDGEGCNHDSVNPRTIAAPSEEEYLTNLKHVTASANPADYRARRKAPGISKPSIFSGLARNRMLGVPGMNSADIMHWACLNWTDIFISLFRGTIKCEAPDSKKNWRWAVLTGDVWKHHGEAVAKATPYLPGSFERPPRNPAEKMSSGYKAWEWLLYMIGLPPALLRPLLPHEHWTHFCMGVSIIQCFLQRRILRLQLMEAHKHAIKFVEEFETLYVQRMPERIHFVRQSIHAMIHLAPEVIRIGPQANYAQWTMERTIGNLGQELKQDSNPYSNLLERSEYIGDGYSLMGAKDKWKQTVTGESSTTIRKYLDAEQETGDIKLKRWARLRLPNGQIARSAWKEKKLQLMNVRMARNVKVKHEGRQEIAEVEFFCQTKDHVLALGSLYPRLDEELLKASYNTVWLYLFNCTSTPSFPICWFPKPAKHVDAAEPLERPERTEFSLFAFFPHACFALATHEDLLGNPHYKALYEQARDLHSCPESLLAAYHLLATTIPQVFTVIPNPMGITAPVGLPGVLPITPNIPEYTKEQSPEIKFWKSKDWKTYAANHGDFLTIKKKKDKKSDSDDEDEDEAESETGDAKLNVLGFLEHDDGTPFEEEERDHVRQCARENFITLQAAQRAPLKWSLATAEVTAFFRGSLSEKVPAVAFAHLNWKVDVVGTVVYAQWSRYRREALKAQHPNRAVTSKPSSKRDNIFEEEVIPAARLKDMGSSSGPPIIPDASTIPKAADKKSTEHVPGTADTAWNLFGRDYLKKWTDKKNPATSAKVREAFDALPAAERQKLYKAEKKDTKKRAKEVGETSAMGPAGKGKQKEGDVPMEGNRSSKGGTRRQQDINSAMRRSLGVGAAWERRRKYPGVHALRNYTIVPGPL
ncbi:hypothetical protein DFH07DRAFT_958303 [Mycena maculata]|uniref:Uncharacterized protein n=1 Tax=Mycena maculata TaxID=230809 RepID=A0AAD7NFU4_9AGAR|nr:hypothetical protein DFH07DRAFT_958303 [Mycena maculata]